MSGTESYNQNTHTHADREIPDQSEVIMKFKWDGIIQKEENLNSKKTLKPPVHRIMRLTVLSPPSLSIQYFCPGKGRCAWR